VATARLVWRDAGNLVYNMINIRKPVVSAINGVAVGAGLAVGLLADISIAADGARLIDGHTKLGVVAGDHAALIWPLLCGLARSKYYLLLCEDVLGKDAAAMGLVSRSVPAEELMATALQVADRLANGSQWAIQGTKQVLNSWLKNNISIFNESLALEMASLQQPDVKEGQLAFAEKRAPQFPSAKIVD
jgi:enoyl-CoA hydratase